MKRISNERYQESYVEETLDNGLHVVLWQKPDYERSLFMMATPLGALDMKQQDEQGNIYEFPAGIAHFLEHKMFEMEEGDVMDMFSQMGANVNAFTSYTETAYYFSTTGDVVKPLHLLLDFVQSLHISEESVEKEKGIIIQELNMYKQMSDQRLLMETFSSLYQHHPLRYDIGGDSESVTSITLEQLKQCYQLNYHPSTMILVGVSAKDPNMLLDEIKKNQEKKHFDTIRNVKRQMLEEPSSPSRKEYDFAMDISMPKISIAYKMTGKTDIYERIKTEWCIRMILDAYFSSLNHEYQSWLDADIINDFVGSEVDLGKDYGMMMFYGETLKKEEFLSLVKDIVHRIKQDGMSADILDQLKKRYFGQSLRSLNSFDDIAITMVRNYFDRSDFFQSMDVLYDITLEDVSKACEMIDESNFCIVELQPMDKK